MIPSPPLELLVLSGSTILSVRGIRVFLNYQKQPICLFCSSTTAVLCSTPDSSCWFGFDPFLLPFTPDSVLTLRSTFGLSFHSIYCYILNMQFSTLKTSEWKCCSWDGSRRGTIQDSTSFIQFHLPCWYLVVLSPLSYNPPAHDLFSFTAVVLKLEHASESPGGLVKHGLLDYTIQLLIQ